MRSIAIDPVTDNIYVAGRLYVVGQSNAIVAAGWNMGAQSQTTHLFDVLARNLGPPLEEGDAVVLSDGKLVVAGEFGEIWDASGPYWVPRTCIMTIDPATGQIPFQPLPMQVASDDRIYALCDDDTTGQLWCGGRDFNAPAFAHVFRLRYP